MRWFESIDRMSVAVSWTKAATWSDVTSNCGHWMSATRLNSPPTSHIAIVGRSR